MITVIIGIAILFLGVGLFLGKMLNKEFFDKLKQKQQEKLKQKEIRREMEFRAREEALKSMYPELVKKMKEDELKKLTGEDKKDKLQKFANAFSMGGPTNSGEDKISRMLGNSGFSTDTNKILGNTNVNTQINNKEVNTNPNKILGNTNINTENNLKSALGTTGLNTNTDRFLDKEKDKDSEEERIKRLIGL